MSEIPLAIEQHHDAATLGLSVNNPHDAFFKAIMTDVRMAKSFLSIYLPEKFKSRCNLSTLALKSGSFIESNLRQHFSDILYSVQMNGLTSYVYCLLEHVSHAKLTTAFQVLRYQVAAMHQHMKQGHDRPPIVIPIVFYRGKKSPYPQSCDVFECFEDPALARETLLAPHLLVDLSIIPDEELASHREIAMMELLQKHILVRDLADLVGYLVAPDLRQYLSRDQFKSVIHYLKEAGYSQDYEAFLQRFNQQVPQPTDRIIMQTLGDYLKAQGRQEGIQEGMQKGIKEGIQKGIQDGIQKGIQDGLEQARLQYAREMLLAHVDPSIVKQLTHLTDEELAQLLN